MKQKSRANQDIFAVWFPLNLHEIDKIAQMLS